MFSVLILSILSILFESASGYLDDSVLRGALNAFLVDINFPSDGHLSINVAPRMAAGVGQFPGEIVWQLLKAGLL